MYDDEYYYCNECEAEDCQICGHGFYVYDEDEIEPECPCCGSMDVQV